MACHGWPRVAIILRCFGIKREQFTNKERGLDVKLTGVGPAKVVKGILV